MSKALVAGKGRWGWLVGAFAGVELISIVEGVRRDGSAVTEGAAVQLKSLWGLKRDQGQLLVLTDPLYRDGTDANRLAVEAISSTFLRESAGSITSRLTRALREANRVLCGENSRAIFSHRRHLSAVCAFVNPEEAYFAQVGPSLILLIRDGELLRLGERALSVLSAGCLGRDFGFEIHYSHTALEPGDIVILSSPGLAKVANRETLLAYISDPGHGSLADRLHRLYEDATTHADVAAIMVEPVATRVTNRVGPKTRPRAEDEKRLPEYPGISPHSAEHLAPHSNRRGRGNDESSAVEQRRAESAGPATRPPLPAAGASRRGGRGGARPLHTNTLRTSGAVESGEGGSKGQPLRGPGTQEPPPPPIRDVTIEFKGSKAVGGAFTHPIQRPIAVDPMGDRSAAPADRGTRRPSSRPNRLKNPLSSWLIPALALAVLSVLGFALLAGYELTRGSQDPGQAPAQPRPPLQEALQLEQDALATDDPSLKRRLLAQANKLASSAAFEKGDPNLAEANARIRAELDRAAAVTRLSNASILVDLSREAASAESLAMLAQGSEIYVLDRESDTVYKFLLDDSGHRVQPSPRPVILRRGDIFGEATVKDLFAAAWIPGGGAKARGTLLVFDASGIAFEYDPSASVSPWRVFNMDFLARHVAVEGYAGNLYVLDPQKGELVWYPPSQTGYGGTVYNYFNPETNVDVSTAIDFALDGSLYLLHRNGRTQKFFAGRPLPFDPIVPGTPITAPTSIFASQAARYVYVVDAGNGRVVQLNKDGSFERQLQSGGHEDLFRSAKSISVDEKRGYLYVLSGKKIVALALEAKSALETKQP